VFLLCHSAIGSYIRENYNVSTGITAASGCTIDPFAPQLAPLLIRGNKFVYPSTAGQRNLQFFVGETIDFACPGGNLVLQGILQTLDVAPAKCVGGTQFTVNNKNYEWPEEVVCKNPKWSTKPKELTKDNLKDLKVCSGTGKEIEIGFAITTSRFIRTMLICYDVQSQTTLYSNYELTSAINQGINGAQSPQKFIQGAGFFTIKDVNSLYMRVNQKYTINRLLGLPSTSTHIFKDNSDYFLSRGHLTAKRDFFYAAQQNSTFHYLNVLPQWKTVNGANWNKIEQSVRDYAEKNNVELQVWTGGFGITTLPHDKTNEETKLFLGGNEPVLPVPEIFWKVVYNPASQRGVAFIGVNNPYKVWTKVNKFCEDMSTWLSWGDKNDEVKGFSWVCTVDDFRKLVKTFPELKVVGYLGT